METLMRRWQWATVLAVVLLSGCGYNTIQQRRRADQGGLVRGAEPVPAARRPRAEPRQDRQGLRQAGEGRAHARHRGARERRHRSRRRRSSSTTRRPSSEVPGRRRASSPARCRGCWWSPRTIRSSSRTPSSATCRRSSRAPRTASRSRATATSRRCRSTTSTVRAVPDQPHRDGVRLQVEAQLHRRERDARSPRPPKVDFGKPAEVERRAYRVRLPCRRPRAAVAASRRVSAAWADVPVPPLKARVTDLTGTLTPRAGRARSSSTLRGVRSAQGQPDRGADRAHHAAGDDRAVLAARRRAVEDRPQGRRRRRACSSSRRTTASCASRSATASRAC